MTLVAWRSSSHIDWLVLAVLCALSILSFPARGKGLAGKTTLSFASIIILSSVALLGPLGAAVVGAVSPLGGLRQTNRFRGGSSTSAMNSLLAGFAGLVYLWVGGVPVNADMRSQIFCCALVFP